MRIIIRLLNRLYRLIIHLSIFYVIKIYIFNKINLKILTRFLFRRLLDRRNLLFTLFSRIIILDLRVL